LDPHSFQIEKQTHIMTVASLPNECAAQEDLARLTCNNSQDWNDNQQVQGYYVKEESLDSLLEEGLKRLGEHGSAEKGSQYLLPTLEPSVIESLADMLLHNQVTIPYISGAPAKTGGIRKKDRRCSQAKLSRLSSDDGTILIQQ
jgi:hypothetical protein